MNERTVEVAWMSLVAVACLWAPTQAQAAGYDPYAVVPKGPIEVDMSQVLTSAHAQEAAPQHASQPGSKLPAGWVQLGEVVQREEVAMGLKAVDPEPSAAYEDIEGNQYPRKHTLFLNFNGGVLYGGQDNSAENKSTLAAAGKMFPGFGKSEASALAIVQRVKEDMSALGVRVVYEKRPNKTIPYTMAMIGGSWKDVNIDSPAGGVAPGTDCEARGQRHVVFVFDSQASTVGQEAAHSWGLDHTLGGDRIMSYQFGTNKHFGDNCQDLCEEACQGKGTIGCRSVHDKYCGAGSNQQNDMAELSFIFGTSEPDVTPPEVKIVAPADGLMLAQGDSVVVAGEIHDDYGGVGWKMKIAVDGEVVFDQVDYDRALNWNLKKLPPGVYELTLEAEDHADHVVRDTITFTVMAANSGTDSDAGTGTGSGSDSDSGETPTTSATDPSGGPGETGGGSGDSSGSGEGSDSVGADDGGCTISREGRGSMGLLVPVLGLGLAWRARRRRA